MNINSKILILGANGLVGKAICNHLKKKNYTNLLLPSRKELNLFNQQEVLSYFKKYKPEFLVLAAAKVGGIQANNTFRADFIFQNILIETNVFNAAFKTSVKRFLFLGSTCIYPKNCPQPIKEEYLLTSPLESTNEPYAIAKIAGLKMAESFRKQYGVEYFSAMPTNLYGPNDNFHKENSHVIPGLIIRMKEAIDNNLETFEVWGSGKPKREFLYVEDLADACEFLLKYNGELPNFVNVGSEVEVSIKNLAQMIANIMCYKGKLVFNTQYPDGTMRKLTDCSKIRSMGWSHKTSLKEGLEKSINYFLQTKNLRSS